MTTINNQDDFLEALWNNPAWREAVRALILGDELLQLPVRFDALAQEFNAFAREQSAFAREQSARTANLEERVGRIESDTGAIKGDFARTRPVQDAQNIAYDMGLEFVRTLSSDELRDMAGNTLPRDVGRSFRNTDLVIQATDGADGRGRRQVHSDGGLLHGGPRGLQPGRPECRTHHPVHRESGAGRRGQRQERGGGGGVRGGVLAPAGGPHPESRVASSEPISDTH